MKNITASILAIAILSTVPCYAAPNLLFEQGDRVRTMAKTLPVVPADWRFLVFDEVQWNRITTDNGFKTRTAVSNLKAHITYVREAYAIAATDFELRQSLAHEMGHYLCGCTNEDKANSYQAKVLRGEIQ